MTTILKSLKISGLAFLLAAFNAQQAQAAVTDLANAPLVVSNTSSVPVMPNIFQMVDDSGSMGWDYLPDNAGNFAGNYGYYSAQCNGVYYNPNIAYVPPVTSTGTSYANSTFTAAPNDGFGTTGTGTTNLSTSFTTQGGGGGGYGGGGGSSTGPAFYFNYYGTQTTQAQKNYYTTSSNFYKECNSSYGSAPGWVAPSAGQVFSLVGVGISSTLTITAASSAAVTGITVNAKQIMSGTTGTQTSPSALATSIASKINACTAATSGSCTIAGYTAVAAGPQVAIIAPAGTTLATPVISSTGATFATIPALTNSGPGNTNETTNFANWYTYYRTRILMMKTESGLAFNSLGTNYRVGFATMNNNGGNKLLNVNQFTASQRTAYYNMLYSVTVGSSTPLLGALASVGQYYANKLPGNSLNNVTATDPIQYSCQQNFTILSTDGFWNSLTGDAELDGSTMVGEQDGTEVRPMYDGASNTSQTTTVAVSVTQKQLVTPYTTTTPWNRTYTTLGSSCRHSTGTTVTTQNQLYNETATGTNTSVDNYTTVTTTSVATVNGQTGTPVVTTAGPTITTVSSSNTGVVDSGAPSSSTTWTNSGGSTTTCVASPPPSGYSTPTAGSSTTTNGSQTVTVLSGPTTTTPSTYNGNPNPNTTSSSSGGTSNTLADVAEYYYITDLRTSALGNATGALGTDVTQNNVPTSGQDTASWQHMTTFTLGLGARGDMVFSPTYLTDTSGDFYAVKNGSLANGSTICSWQASGTTCNWPIPVSNTQTTVDDLWHAAVNGRGTYFSATDPATLGVAISTALAGVSARTGATAAATTSNPNITSGDNFVFSSTFVTQDWYGELVEQQLNLTTGQTLPTINWSAQAQLDANASRTIYARNSSASNGLQAFNATNFGANAYFNLPNISSLSQFCTSGITCLPVWQANYAYSPGNEYRVISGTTAVWYHVNTAYTSGTTFGTADTANTSVVTGAAGSNLVNYLTGDRTNEGISADTTKYFRQRIHLLGDIVDGEAVYVKGSLINFADLGFSSYASTISSRQSMVYVAANDGMLHALYAADNPTVTNPPCAPSASQVCGGEEAWAYIPTMVMPNLYKLADKNYANNHQYYVDGTPVAGDICVSNCGTASSVWKTILVGGLNGGGRGYYALDITNPAAPKSLWEFTDPNMGYTYGNPQIAKLKDGTWVVYVTSGYNNVSPGDGMGHLYVLNAYTGAVIHDISTGASTTTPSGLARIIAQVANTSSDETTLEIYGGDLLGNVWRFNVDPWLPNHAYNAGDGYWVGTTWYQVTTAYTSGSAFGSTDTTNATSGTSISSPVYGAQLLATLQGPTGLAQPITDKPEVGLVSGTTMVYVGTGRYLGSSDLTNTDPQSIYGIKDPLTAGTAPSAAIYPNPRSVTYPGWIALNSYAVGTQYTNGTTLYTVTTAYTSGSLFGNTDTANTTQQSITSNKEFVQQTLTTTTCPAGSPATICNAGQIVTTGSRNTVNLAVNGGWFVDLPGSGERATNDPTLQLGTLGFTTNTPSVSSCTVGGTSNAYFFDYRTGAPVSTSTTGVVGIKLGNALATRPVYVHLPNNTVVQLIRLSDGTTLTTNVPIGSGAAGIRRVSWRELINQ